MEKIKEISAKDLRNKFISKKDLYDRLIKDCSEFISNYLPFRIILSTIISKMSD